MANGRNKEGIKRILGDFCNNFKSELVRGIAPVYVFLTHVNKRLRTVIKTSKPFVSIADSTTFATAKRKMISG